MIVVVLLFFIFTALVLSKKAKRSSHSPKVHFCDNGMDGHNERVADFYGYSSYKEMLKEDGIDLDKIEQDIKDGKIKRVSVNFKEWLDEESEKKEALP